MDYTIQDLKKSLVNGGARKNKYLIELSTPIIGFDESKLHILCQGASFPERLINTTTIWHKGRKYNVRSETEYPGTWTLTFYDDSDLTLRKGFDKWAKFVDNSKPVSGGILGNATSSSGIGQITDLANSAIDLVDDVGDFISDPFGESTDYITGLLDPNSAYSEADYQVDINVWQLDANKNKVYGYTMQNAFVSGISSVEFSASELDTLVEFSVTFTYSEFTPIESDSNTDALIDATLGDDVTTTIDNAESIFD